MWNLQSSSKIIQQIEQQRCYQIHKQKLKNIKPTFKIKQPQQPQFVYKKHKLQMARRQRLIDIDHNNDILVKKMAKIFDDKHSQDKLKPQSQWLKTLNQTIQSNMNEKINKQNSSICKRLMEVNSFYPTSQIIKNTSKLNKIKVKISENARRLNKSVKSLRLRPNSAVSSKNLLVRTGTIKDSRFQSMQRHQEDIYKFQRKTRPESAPSRRFASLTKSKQRLQNIKHDEEYETLV